MLGGVVKQEIRWLIGNISGEVIDMARRSTIVRDRGGKWTSFPTRCSIKPHAGASHKVGRNRRFCNIVLKPSADLEAVTEIIRAIKKLLHLSLIEHFLLRFELPA